MLCGDIFCDGGVGVEVTCILTLPGLLSAKLSFIMKVKLSLPTNSLSGVYVTFPLV